MHVSHENENAYNGVLESWFENKWVHLFFLSLEMETADAICEK